MAEDRTVRRLAAYRTQITDSVSEPRNERNFAMTARTLLFTGALSVGLVGVAVMKGGV